MARAADPLPVAPPPVIDGAPCFFLTTKQTYRALGVGREAFRSLLRDHPRHPIARALLAGRSTNGVGKNATVSWHYENVARACELRRGNPWPVATKSAVVATTDGNTAV